MPRVARDPSRAADRADPCRHRSGLPAWHEAGFDAEVRFLGDLAAGNLIVEPVAAADWMRIAEMVAQFRYLPLGTVDASVIAAAERLGVSDLATIDRRHFTVVQSKIGALNLVP